jgi:hypothetical protein
MGMKHPVRVRWYTILLAVVLGGILAAARGRSRSNIVVVLTRQPWRTDQQPIQRRTWRTFRRWVELYFLSNRPCGTGDTVLDANIWVARRSAPWTISVPQSSWKEGLR